MPLIQSVYTYKLWHFYCSINKSCFLFRHTVNRKNSEISEMIMEYLQQNPDAGDTLEGISHFWLDFERVDHTVDEVSNALESLLRQGAVTKTESEGGMPIYRLSKNA